MWIDSIRYIIPILTKIEKIITKINRKENETDESVFFFCVEVKVHRQLTTIHMREMLYEESWAPL